jgi:hypothetical protein
MLDFPISENLTTVGHLMTSPLSTPKDWAGDIIQLRKLINNIAGDCNDREYRSALPLIVKAIEHLHSLTYYCETTPERLKRSG